MSEIIDIVRVKCKQCKRKVLADKHDCGCIFAYCEVCGIDFEYDTKCTNHKKGGKRNEIRYR